MHKHGGKRVGAGRPALGVTKKVSITLSEEDWKRIEKIARNLFSQFFRELTLKEFEK
jgi:hypothetical protein